MAYFLLFTLNENQITPEGKTNLIFTCIWATLGIIGTSIYLHFQNKKFNKKHRNILPKRNMSPFVKSNQESENE